ncbi:MAG: HAMP domain-containing histidine kinase [Nitrospirae bacterium]|nr:HAMP domain-containing histidine kinase [Nitrospirota bacterium]
MSKPRKYYIVFISVITAVITYLYYSTLPGIHELHDIYREFYYMPVFLSALLFGLKGAVLALLLVLAMYLPDIYLNWTGNFASEADTFLHLALQGLFGLFAGFLIDRDKQRRKQLEKERYLAGLGQVATTIVHDLKNPLITIMGFARRIQDGKGETEAAVKAIMDSAGNMQKIVYDVLDFARPMHLELKEEDIRNVIRKACDSCRTKTERWGINISVDLSDEPLNMMIDSFNLERAIVNIINNAIEASSKGQDITISTTAEKNHMTVRIRDNGAGMDRETLDNIFIPFYTKKSWGTGLGMCISKKIIEGHQGDIGIVSNPNQGTEVSIRLPYKVTVNKPGKSSAS